MTGGRKGLIFIVLAGLLAAGVGVLSWQWLRTKDPCETEGREQLLARFPALQDLRAKQKAETERLLTAHRKQDLMINFDLGGRRISSEEALRLSLQQIDELAELRRRHQEEFQQRCHEIASGPGR